MMKKKKPEGNQPAANQPKLATQAPPKQGVANKDNKVKLTVNEDKKRKNDRK